MDNLVKFKEAILQKKQYDQELQTCYEDFLTRFDSSHATIFLNLLEMCEPSERIEEIFKVFDFVRFPVKKFNA